MGSPAVRLLKGGAEDPGRPFALCGQTGWRLRVFSSPEREAVVRALQSMASQKLALQLAGEGLPMEQPSLLYCVRQLPELIGPEVHGRQCCCCCLIKLEYLLLLQWTRGAS